MQALRWALSKIMSFADIPRYARELPAYISGVARATTLWGDVMRVPFPEFRSIVEKGYITGHGEEGVYEYLNTHLSGKDIFFDIGANAGFYSLLGAHKGADTYSFEPFPSTLKLLASNANGKQVRVYPYAVSDKSGALAMEAGKHPGLNKVSDTGTVQVESLSLDDFGVVPTIMKVDVEGHEMSVFKGAQTLLAGHSPVIVAEVSPESKNYLESLGYKAALLGKTNYVFTK